jgi:SAM-dependent methyltransferase
MFIDTKRPWLAGYVPGGDPATYYPGLWDWLVGTQEVRSVIDVGCGEGHALRYFRDRGCKVLGVDGIEQDDPDIVTHDYATDPVASAPGVIAQNGWLPWRRYVGGDLNRDGFDLAWSCEFVEHVEERYVPNFLATFQCARLVLMTHAEPGQQGHHHVNCRTGDYWKGALAAFGYQFDAALTEQTRRLAAVNPDPHNHYRRSGLAFVRS